MISTFFTRGAESKIREGRGPKNWKKWWHQLWKTHFKKYFLEQKKTEGIRPKPKGFFFHSSAFSFSLVGPNIARISRWPAMKLFFQHWVGDAIDPWWALFAPHCFHLCAKLHDQKSHQTQKFHRLTNAGIYQLPATLCCFCLCSLEPEIIEK